MRSYISSDAALQVDCFQVLWEDGDRALCRGWIAAEERNRRHVLALRLTAQSPQPGSVDRLVHEYNLKDHLESAWAARPLELIRRRDGTMLVLEDPGGEPLDRQLGEALEVSKFLPLAISLTRAVRQVHQRGLVHADLKPPHILVNDGHVHLTGFGLASRLPRERQSPGPPEFIAGTLAFMAPEQTGWMNRSIDSRSDLYALGVIFYKMLTGVLPFTASHPMEWIHCHIARTPLPPRQRVLDIAEPISQIVMKLLAKTAEERYQTAAGVERDLQRCLAAWQATGRIDAFVPGETDTPDRLSTPERLYGREVETETLLGAYDRVARSGTSELLLVCGYSGIGKSSFVHELHKAIVPTRGLFAAGKFDPHQRDVPYRTVAGAFRALILGFIGSRTDLELEGWRGALREAVGLHGRTMIELIPELELMIGKQPPASEIPPRQSHRLFQIALRRFVGVFARPEHPLVLFLDDLQWADAATLDLLEALLVGSDLHHLLVIGAYRDNEIDPAHPLVRKLAAIGDSAAKVRRIKLRPLDSDHLAALVGHALRCAPARAAPLAQLIHEKTGGNPFFASRFLSTLADEGLLAFDSNCREWRWDLARIRTQGHTENVVELMLDKLGQLPLATRTVLEQLACLGSSARTAMLASVLGTSEDSVHAALWEAARHDLVEQFDASYGFVHDRIHEAAYSSMHTGQRALAHLQIGRLLVAQTAPEKWHESIFDIVNQLNRGIALITALPERLQLARFNLTAGLRANASTAFAAALTYFSTGRNLLTQECWESHRELLFALELHRAECEVLTGAFVEAESHFRSLSARATGMAERASVARVGVDLYILMNQHVRAIGVGRDYLSHIGIHWSSQPTDEEARSEYRRIWSELDRRTNDELMGLPLMTDPPSLATLDLLNRLSSPAQFIDLNLYTLAVCKMLALTLDRGNSDASAVAYARLGMVAGLWGGEYERAQRAGQLANELVERRGLRRFEAGVYLNLGNMIMPWTRHLRACCEVIGNAFAAAQKTGDLMYAGVCSTTRILNIFALGEILADILLEAQEAQAFMHKAQLFPGFEILNIVLATVRMLRGETGSFGSLNDGQFDEQQIERAFAGTSELTGSKCWYWISKLRARFFGGDYAAAVEAAARAQPMLNRSSSLIQVADYYFYSALSHALICNLLPIAQRTSHLETLATHQRQLTEWAATCPQNFEDRAMLVSAEVARLAGRELEAERLYAQSIRTARANGFIHNEALAYELAYYFYAERGLDEIAEMHLLKASSCYSSWGAQGKVRQLEAAHPHRGSGSTPGPSGTIGVPVDQLDLATVIKVSQAVSSEIVLEKLIDTMMRTAIEQAGAERGVLVIWRGGEFRCVAQASTRNDTISVELQDEPLAQAVLSQSILQYVLRTREPVILGDAAAEHPFAAEPYIRERQTRSVLCLPLLTQAKLGGVLYLENNLAPCVFVQARAVVLKLLASQAASALENAGLYQDVAEREAKIRRLVDANIIGTFIWQAVGSNIETDDILITDANDAFLRMLGYSRDDIAAGRLSRLTLTPPPTRAGDAPKLRQLRTTGVVAPFEKEYLRKDGTHVPVLVGIAAFDSMRDRGVAFVVDLTERKRAEAQAREVQMELRRASDKLTQATQVASLAELSASIAHEVNQPLAAIAANSDACHRWLSAFPPNIERAKITAERITRDANSAADVVSRIRALFRRSPDSRSREDINGLINGVCRLMAEEIAQHDSRLRTNLEPALPSVVLDRVQVQQVLVNLIRNAIESMDMVDSETRAVYIRSCSEGPHAIRVEITDAGTGFKDPERAFEPFFTTKQKGMGMGLAICRSIVESHGGRLWAANNSTGGATVTFTLAVHELS